MLIFRIRNIIIDDFIFVKLMSYVVYRISYVVKKEKEREEENTNTENYSENSIVYCVKKVKESSSLLRIYKYM